MEIEKIKSLRNGLKVYVSPLIEIFGIDIERGFAASSGENEQWNENSGGGDF